MFGSGRHPYDQELQNQEEDEDVESWFGYRDGEGTPTRFDPVEIQ